jgi:hypothetical protein
MDSNQLVSKPDMKKVRSLINRNVLEMLRKSRFCGRLSVKWEMGEVVDFIMGTHVGFSISKQQDEDDFLSFDMF